MKVVLGTVQFGLNYGINNQCGKVSIDEVNKILITAYQSGIRLLDTSAAYGNSEEVLGLSLPSNHSYRIISKYPKSDKSVNDVLKDSLNHLHQKSIYGYLVHHFDFYLQNPNIWTDFETVKRVGKVQKIGFSIYSPEQLEILFSQNIHFDLVQFPYNIFDRQFEPYFEELKKRNVEIYTRSAFLQGLFFKDINTLPEKLIPLCPHLQLLHSYCDSHNMPIEQIALNYVYNNPCIDGVLIGVDNVSQLLSNLNTISKGITSEDYSFINSIIVKDKNLLNPVNWK